LLLQLAKKTLLNGIDALLDDGLVRDQHLPGVVFKRLEGLDVVELEL
jgi:hypothetical protein